MFLKFEDLHEIENLFWRGRFPLISLSSVDYVINTDGLETSFLSIRVDGQPALILDI